MADNNHAERKRRAILKIKATRALASKITQGSKKSSRHPGVPLLTGGPDSNLMVWKKQIRELILEIFGDLGMFTDTNDHYVPEEIEFDEDELTPENDPHGFKKGDIKDRMSLRFKEVKKELDPCFTVIKGTLSPEIESRIKELDGYAHAAETYDPLLIYLLAVQAATGNGPAESKVISAAVSRERYAATKKEREEGLSDFLERYTFALDQQAGDNDIIVEDEHGEITVTPFFSDAAISVDFLSKLDEAGWGEFRNKVINDDTSKSPAMPGTLALMYARACAFRPDTGRQTKSAGTVFVATQDPQPTWHAPDGARGAGRGADRGGRSAARGAGPRGAGARGAGPRGAARSAGARGAGARGPAAHGAGSRGAGSAQYHVRVEQPLADDRACFECGEVGHLRHNCPTLATGDTRYGYTMFSKRRSTANLYGGTPLF